MHYLNEALKKALEGNFDESEKILRENDNNDLRTKFNLGWHEIRHGRLLSGFEHLNYGRFLNVFGLPRIKGDIWKNQNLEDKILLFRCEGGYGDQILNFRFANEFKKMGANVVISCAPSLKEIFSRHGYICVDNEVVSSIYYDYWVPAMSAPYILNKEYSDIYGNTYIQARERKKLYSKEKKLKVGIRWSGNPEFEHEQYRRFPPEMMINLYETPNTTFYSFQRDENTIDGLPFSDLKESLKTWDDTASFIEDCDLIISSCTSLAHLSAAMGKPTWIIVPILCYYTWGLPGEKTPWYNSVRLFRQEKFGEWESVFSKVRNELEKYAQNFVSEKF